MNKNSEIPRIYFDTNLGSMEFGYPLIYRDSLRELELISDNLKDGLHVIIYMTGELEVEAILRFDHENDLWIGVPISTTLKYI